jgi:hypothetical protein
MGLNWPTSGEAGGKRRARDEDVRSERSRTRSSSIVILDRSNGRLLNRFRLTAEEIEQMGQQIRFLRNGRVFFVEEVSPDGGTTLVRRLAGYRIARPGEV